MNANLSRCAAGVREDVLRALDAIADTKYDLATAALKAACAELNEAVERAEQVGAEAARLLELVAQAEALLVQRPGARDDDERRRA